jgi:hypothetical protein
MSPCFLKQNYDLSVLHVGITAKNIAPDSCKDKHKIQLASAIGIISPPAEKPLWDLLTLTARFGKFSREPRPGQGQQCPVPDVV